MEGFEQPTRLRSAEGSQRFPGRKRVDTQIFKKYSRGTGVDSRKVKDPVWQAKIEQRERKLQKAEEEAARAEVLLTEYTGELEAEDGTNTAQISQKEIKNAVDVTTAAKGFDLDLDFGPYKMNYTKNGRNLVIGGKQGHLASFDWVSKKLNFEINVMESIHDVCFLHTPNMVAAAQKSYVYIYDGQGIEIHCLRKMSRVLCLDFLPYHFLLCSSSEDGVLTWLDVSLGKSVISTNTHLGRLSSMCQNPYNAVLCCGHQKGTVTMWTPNNKEPVLKMLCHNQAIRCLAVDPTGKYMATAAVDRVVKIWDARNLGEALGSYRLGAPIGNLAFSQKGLLAASMRNVVEVYSNVVTGKCKKAYMCHKANTIVNGMKFCPYEDVLGISTYGGYSSLIIPGSGEPNFDAFEANPYISTAGRKEAEVKSLLSKIPSELITLDPNTIAQVDTPTLEEKLEAKRQLLYVPVPDIDVEPRYRMKGKSGSAYKFKRKRIMHEAVKRKYYKDAHEMQEAAGLGEFVRKKRNQKPNFRGEVLERFHKNWKLKERPSLVKAGSSKQPRADSGNRSKGFKRKRNQNKTMDG